MEGKLKEWNEERMRNIMGSLLRAGGVYFCLISYLRRDAIFHQASA